MLECERCSVSREASHQLVRCSTGDFVYLRLDGEVFAARVFQHLCLERGSDKSFFLVYETLERVGDTWRLSVGGLALAPLDCVIGLSVWAELGGNRYRLLEFGSIAWGSDQV
jgi:hypothetical protein